MTFSANRDEAGQQSAGARQVVAEQYVRLTSPGLSPAGLFEHRVVLARIVAGAFAVIERHAPDLNATCRECSRPADHLRWPCPTRVDVALHLFSPSPPLPSQGRAR